MLHGLVVGVVFLLRAALATALVAAGAAKLMDTRGFAATLVGLGVPARPSALVRGLALTIPLLELGLGVAMVSGLWATSVNIAVLALLSSFSVTVLVALHRAPQVACRCFGALSESQFSKGGLARSLLLTGIAGLVFWTAHAFSLRFDGPPSVVLLVLGYLIFGAAAAQAADTMALLKARMH